MSKEELLHELTRVTLEDGSVEWIINQLQEKQ